MTAYQSHYQYYLFDLDGTLTDPGIGITNSVMYALEQYGIHVPDRSQLYRFIGPPLKESFMGFYGFSEEQALEAVEHYRVYFRAGGIFENTVYPGIPQMLQELRDQGKTIALATSKPEEFALQILEHFDLMHWFDLVQGATMDGRISQKADVIAALLQKLDPGRTDQMLMVGDREHDILGARANGLESAGVLWGYGSAEELKKAGADHLVSAPAEIPLLMSVHQ